MLKIIPDSDARGTKLIAAKPFAADEVIFQFSTVRRHSYPTYRTIQVDHNLHIEQDTLAHLNHSCRPNTRFNSDVSALIALCNIEKGEELTYFYPSTEWEMVRPFKCLCRSDNCIGQIVGARSLEAATWQHYEFSAFIRQMFRTGPR